MGDREKEVDKIMDSIDDLLLLGNFTRVDAKALRYVGKEVPLDHQLAYLTITLTAKDHLKNRSKIYNSAYENLVATRGEEFAESTLKGLE